MGKDGILKRLLGKSLEGFLEAEMVDHLGYHKHSVAGNNTGNSRNGYKKKTIQSEQGKLNIRVPHDRNGEFEPKVIPKHTRRLGGLEDTVLSLYSKGLSTRDIQEHIKEIYGASLSSSAVSMITDKVHIMVQEWKNRPLQSCYPILFLDAVHFKVRQDGHYVSKAAYNCFAIDTEGRREILGIWIGQAESSTFWTSVLTDLKNRGVEEVLIACVDGLTGFDAAIEAIFPKTVIQNCVVHQIRNAFKHLAYKDRKPFMADLKEVYAADTLEMAETCFEKLKDKWADRYNAVITSWENNWAYLTPFFSYSKAIRKIMYTTNSIENLHRQFRKVTRSKNVFPSDQALMKSLFMAQDNLTDKWCGKIGGWVEMRAELIAHFGERFTKYLM
jgi:transposase-like protein